MRRLGYLLSLVTAIALIATAGFAKDGKLKIKVTPKQAYVFVDGNAIRDGNQSISLSPGKHTVVVANYGYKLSTQDVTIEDGKSTPLEVKLDPQGDKVAGPFGLVIFNGDPRAAVLSNGTTPGYFVGHVDEFNNDFIWHQNLLLPPGTHHTTVTHQGKTIWAGDVNVVANKKVVIYLNKNKTKTVDWKRGEQMKDLPRFHAGIASATVAVSPVTGSLNVGNANINCGQSSTLNWTSTDAVDTNISGIGAVQQSGNQSVSPKATTNYDFTATGPGGSVKQSGTVNVNTKVDASISANPTEVTYHKMGDKVVKQDTTTLTWQTSHADSVTVDGQTVAASGTQTETPAPADTTTVQQGQPPRNIDETKNYALNATNVCGGSATQTAPVHITGVIEAIPEVTLQSIFYPTDYPDKRHPQVGLVKSQQDELTTLVTGFKKYLEYDPDAKLSVEAHADVRGSKNHNQDLSERRVERIKQYLVDQGISADKVQTAAYGKDRPMDKTEVKGLVDTNPNPAPKARAKNITGDYYAYNRRADIVLLPSGKKSSQFYPNAADDAGLLWQIPKPALKKVEAAQ